MYLRLALVIFFWVFIGAAVLFMSLTNGHMEVLVAYVVATLLALGMYKFMYRDPKYNFVSISENEVSSELGFTVILAGPAVRYVQNNHMVEVQGEKVRDGIYRHNISVESIERWMPPHQDEEIDIKDRAAVARNIAAALTYLQRQAKKTAKSTN
jgi:hypothetical protein